MIEDVLEEVREKLRLNLSDALAGQDSKYNDEIELEALHDDAITIGNVPLPDRGPPAILMRPVNSGDYHYASSKKDVTHTIEVGVIVDDTDQERAYKRLFRMLRAVENVFEVQFKNGGTYVIQYETVDYDFDASVFKALNEQLTLKAGILTCNFKERVDAYLASQT